MIKAFAGRVVSLWFKGDMHLNVVLKMSDVYVELCVANPYCEESCGSKM